MKTCIARLQSFTPYSSSKHLDVRQVPLARDKESPDDYDLRNWREKATYDNDNNVCIPAMGLKMAVDEAAKRLSVTVKGKKNATYTKFFLSGQICADEPGPCLGVKKDDLEFIEIWANSNGIRGGGSRVRRRFPYIRHWTATARFQILDDVIGEEIFERAVIEAGRLVGVGRFRPERGGLLGRFKVLGFSWSNE